MTHFRTPLATPIHDSRSRPPFATCCFRNYPIPGLASTSSYYPPSCPPPPVALCLLTLRLAHHLLQRSLPPCQAPYPHPHLYHTLCPSLHSPCMGTCHSSFNETTPYYCRGTKHEILGHLPRPYISRRLLDVGIGHSPI